MSETLTENNDLKRVGNKRRFSLFTCTDSSGKFRGHSRKSEICMQLLSTFPVSPPPLTQIHPFFCPWRSSHNVLACHSQAGSTASRIAVSTAQLHATSTSSWITTALISRPLEEQVNTPAVSSLAFHATSSWRTVIETYSPCHTTRTTNWEIGH